MRRLMYLCMLIAFSAVIWGNVIPDPGFESVPLGVIPDGWDEPDWRSWNGGFEAQSAIVRTGSVAIKTGLNTSDYTNLRRSYKPAGSNPSDFENKWWSFSVWIYYDSTEPGNNLTTDVLSIQGVVTNNWNVHRLNVGAEVPATDLVDGAWNYLEFRGKAGESGLNPGDENYDDLVTNRVTIAFHQNASLGVGGTFYIDDVSAAVSTSWLGNYPEDGDIVPYSDPIALSWNLPDPNDAGQDQLVNVAFWNEPNSLLWQEGVNFWTLLTDSPNATGVSATPIDYETQYWWFLQIDNSAGPLADPNGLVTQIYTFTTEPANLVPIVDAGQDQAVILDGGTALAQMLGVVTDDGSTTNTWTVAAKDPAGIADPSFDDTSALDAKVTFTELGVYELTLTADDGEYQISDTVTITVLTEYPSILADDGGFEATPAGVIPDGGDLNIWRSFNGNFEVGSNGQVRSGLQSCLIGVNPLADPSWTFDRYSNLRQSYESAFPEYEIANKTWVASAWVYYDAEAPGNGSVNDKFEFAVQIRNAWNNANIETEIVVKGVELNSGQWNFIQASIDVPEQDLDPTNANYDNLVRKYATVRIEQNGWVGQTGDFYIDDVSLASTEPWHNFDPTPGPGDSVVAVNPLNLSWTNPDDAVKVDVWFADVNDSLWTPADKIVDGQMISDVDVTVDPFTTYYWQVVAYDAYDANTPSEVFTFETLSANLPPVVNAGSDVLTYLDGGTVDVTMVASVTDDGSTVNNWTFTKNPHEIADPAIVPADALNAVVTLTEAGTYTLKLTADDGEYQVSDDMVIYVGDNPCDAAVRDPRGFTPYPGDIFFDCEVTLDDLYLMVVNWLDDNSLTGTVELP